MFPRLFTIALALLAFSGVALGRVGHSNPPNVFAARPNAPQSKAAKNSNGGSRSMPIIGTPIQPGSIEKRIEHGVNDWKELKAFDAFGPPEKLHGLDLKKKLDQKKKRPGQLRRLKNRRRLSEEEAGDVVVKEPVPNLVIP